MTKKGRNRSVNNIKHGGYSLVWERALSRRLDRRTTVVRAMNALRGQLVRDIGGDPSTPSLILIDRIVVKVFRLQALEMAMMEGKADKAEIFYISLSNSLRRDLCVLGLERSPIAIDIERERSRQYLKTLTTEELLELERISLESEQAQKDSEGGHLKLK